MDWFKRHWVDALMVALIVAVVGGVLTLLLRGSGFGAAPPSVTAVQPRQPVAQQPNPAPQPNPTPQPTPSSSPAAPSKPVAKPPSSQPASPAVTPPPAASPATNGVKPVKVVAIPPMSAASSNSASSSSATVKPAVKPSAVNPAPANRPQPVKAQREPLNYARADFLRNYRVAIATYSSATRAQSSAARLRSLGYPAQAFSSGSGFIVVTGPYARESSARSAFNKLRAQGYSDAVLYSPNGNRERSPTAIKPAATPPPATVPAPGDDSSPAQLDPGLSYLQVGAFKTVQSAWPLLERLRGSGFKTLLRSASDGYTRVLVGPFSAARLSDAKQNLSGQGLTPFAVKQ